MNALVITPSKILPASSGAPIYTNGMLKYLKHLGYTTTLVNFYTDEDYSDEEMATLKDYVDDVQTCKLIFQNIKLNMSLRYANSIRKYTRRAMWRLLQDVKARTDFDLVVIDHLHMFEYANLFLDKKVLLHTHNVESNLWLELSQKETGLKKFLISRNYRLLAAYEAEAVLQADEVTAISDADATKLGEMTKNEKKVHVFHGYNKFELIKEETDVLSASHKILFIGDYSWYPNANAALFLIGEVMPILRTLDPQVQLFLVGKRPTEEMQNLAKDLKDVTVTGMVDSIDPYLKEADVFVNAVTEGSGLNIKMIEAMGKGIPLVSSEFGARGFTVADGREVLFYDTAANCAEKVMQLITDRQFALALRNQARVYYEAFVEPSEEIREVFLNE